MNKRLFRSIQNDIGNKVVMVRVHLYLEGTQMNKKVHWEVKKSIALDAMLQ